MVLTYKTHGLLAGTENKMQLTNYVDPGASGESLRWDFSESKNTGDFLGSLTKLSVSRASGLFVAGNTSLEEFGNLFIFNTNERQQEQWGYMAGQGTNRIQYTKPFVKMKFPFSFGNKFSGDFAADYYLNDKVVGTMVGTYTVEGDGLGTLVLPDGKEHKNVLRVKEVKTYEMDLNGQRYAYVDESIRWYAQDYRYALFVLIKSSVSGLNGGTSAPSVSTRAAYSTAIPVVKSNPLAETGITVPMTVKIFPNPFKEQATITVNLPAAAALTIEVFDVSGRLVKQLVSENRAAGEHSFTFVGEGVAPVEGAYIVRVNANGQQSSFRIMEMR